jgi:hypothetical protein
VSAAWRESVGGAMARAASVGRVMKDKRRESSRRAEEGVIGHFCLNRQLIVGLPGCRS